MDESRTGTVGWVILAAFVWAWDTLAPESLSSAYWRALTGRKSRPLVLAAWIWVTSHLFFKVPRRILIRW